MWRTAELGMGGGRTRVGGSGACRPRAASLFHAARNHSSLARPGGPPPAPVGARPGTARAFRLRCASDHDGLCCRPNAGCRVDRVASFEWRSGYVALMAGIQDRHPAGAPGPWFVDDRCIGCGASRHVAPGLIRANPGDGVSYFERQPQTDVEVEMAWRAVMVCPTRSVGHETLKRPPEPVFPQDLGDGVYRLGHNARGSFGAHSYLVVRDGANLMVDSPRWTREVVEPAESLGGIDHILCRTATTWPMPTAMPSVSAPESGSTPMTAPRRPMPPIGSRGRPPSRSCQACRHSRCRATPGAVSCSR